MHRYYYLADDKLDMWWSEFSTLANVYKPSNLPLTMYVTAKGDGRSGLASFSDTFTRATILTWWGCVV